MPTCSVHWTQAEHNEIAAKRLIAASPVQFKDWAAVIAFYSAVHMAETLYYRTENKDHGSHGERNEYVANTFSKEAADSYVQLYRTSRMLRYLEFKGKTYLPKGMWLSDDAALRLVNSDLEKVKEEVTRRITADLPIHVA